MRQIKKGIIKPLFNSYFIDSPLPSNLSYMWNFGSLLGVCLLLQLISGITLAMHYCPNTDLAFASTEHIMRNINLGWLIRYSHANGASFFIFIMYLHICRGLYYGSYTKPRVALWSIGVIIFLLTMATAFLGYVLPWGQMSYWGATVITNFLSAIPWIGTELVEYVWGNFSVSNSTLNRFFSLHYLLPFVISAFVILHFMALHINGSNNPYGFSSNSDKIPFHSYYTFKDLVGFFFFLFFFAIFVFYFPNLLGHSDNYIQANPMVTPMSIVPEIYFLPFYAILRAIPDKLGGVIAMIGSILILLILPFFHTSRIRTTTFRPFHKFFFWIFVGNFLLLLWLGQCPIEEPYITIGQFSCAYYFLYFLFIVPFVGFFENLLVSLHLRS